MKGVFRRSQILGSDRFENDAEHSWHICVMAYTLHSYYESKSGKPDVARGVKMLLLHDIIEVYAGDTYCYDTDAALDKYEREQKAAEEIFGLLPLEIGAEFKALWQEFDEEKTPDAVFAAVMDKLQPFLLNYKNDGKPWLSNKVKKSQVLKRMDLVIKESGPVIGGYVAQLIEDAVKKGYLIDM